MATPPFIIDFDGSYNVFPNIAKAERERGSMDFRKAQYEAIATALSANAVSAKTAAEGLKRLSEVMKEQDMYRADNRPATLFFPMNGKYYRFNNCLVESLSMETERIEQFSSRGGLRAKENVIIGETTTSISLRAYSQPKEVEGIESLDLNSKSKTLDDFSDDELRNELEKRSKNKKVERQIQTGVRILNLES